MKNTLTLFALVAVVTLSSCKKENDVAKPEFAGVEFKLYDLRAIGDTTITEVTYPGTIILKADFTWTIDLGGAKSNGTYTWTPTSNRQGEINFKITNWTDFATNQILSDKLKSALQEVKHFGYSLQSPSFLNFLDNNFQADFYPFVRTNKN